MKFILFEQELERLRPLVMDAGFQYYESNGSRILPILDQKGNLASLAANIFDAKTQRRVTFELSGNIERDVIKAINDLNILNL